jgi:hypothetical protein
MHASQVKGGAAVYPLWRVDIIVIEGNTRLSDPNFIIIVS